MEGNVITIDYAETNNLSKWASCICGEKAVPKDSNIAIKRYGYVLAEKGMGGAGGGGGKRNSLPPNISQIKHIFAKRPGHIPDTLMNRKLIEDIANSLKHYLGKDQRGHSWYAQTRSDGTQVWAEVRDKVIINGGVNQKPKDFDEITGLKNNPKKNYLAWRYEW